MKKTITFENEQAYDTWLTLNEEKDGGYDFLDNRVVIIKNIMDINGRKFSGFSATATIECKTAKTAVSRFIKEMTANGYELSVDDFECVLNGCYNLNDMQGSGMVIEVEEFDDGVFYVNYMCYQDEATEQTEEEETAEETETSAISFVNKNYRGYGERYLLFDGIQQFKVGDIITNMKHWSNGDGGLYNEEHHKYNYRFECRNLAGHKIDYEKMNEENEEYFDEEYTEFFRTNCGTNYDYADESEIMVNPDDKFIITEIQKADDARETIEPEDFNLDEEMPDIIFITCERISD